jgi:hypothetical protein
MQILLAVAAVLTAVLLIPISVSFSFDETARVKVGALCLWVQVYPPVKRTKKEAGPPKKTKPRRLKQKPTVKKPMIENVSSAAALLGRCALPVKKLIRRTTLAIVDFEYIVSGDDAAGTAVDFGKVNAAVYALVSTADRAFRLKVRRLYIAPDFCGRQSRLRAQIKVTLLPAAALIAAVNIGFWLLLFFMRAGSKREKKENLFREEVGNAAKSI